MEKCNGISQCDPAAAVWPAWNAGRQVGAKRALQVRQIWSIRFFLDREGRMRDRALFDLAIDSKLRGCDLVKVKNRHPCIRLNDPRQIDGGPAEDRATSLSLKSLPTQEEVCWMAGATRRLGRQLCVSKPRQS
jgi:hypothetical protein